MKTLNTNIRQSGTGTLLSAVPASITSQAFGRAGGGGLPKVLTIVLCQDQIYRTDGTTTYLQDVYDIDEIRTLGPMIRQMRAHYVCEGGTTNFTCRVTGMWSVLGKTWSSPFDVLSAQTGATTGLISGWHTTDSDFGLLMRYAVEVKNNAGTAIESGRITVVLEIELKS